MPSEPLSDSAPRRRRCPSCGAPRDDAFRPFCSRGCRDRDLIRWFGEDYRVKTEEREADERVPSGDRDDPEE